MKRITAILLILVMALSLLTGCGTDVPEEEAFAGTFEEGQDETPSTTPEKEEEPQKPTEQPKDEPSKEEEKPVEKPEEEPEKQPEEKPEEKPAEQPEENTVTTPKEEELANLYQSSVASTCISYTGKNTKNADFSVSKPIDVKEGDTLTFGPMAAAQVVMGYVYDANGKPIQLMNAHYVKESAVFAGGMKLYTYTVPANGATVKFNVHNNSKSDFVVARNNEFDLKEYSQLSGILADFVDDALKNKKGLFVGDSICIATRDEKMDGMRGWPRRIADTYGMNAVNNGKSGVSVSNKRSQGTVLTQLLEKKTEQYDYVVLHGGVNDAWSLVDVGIMTDGFDPKTFDPATFGGGLELLIYNAILHYGDNASIGYLVNFKAPACQKGTVANMTEYNELAKQICDKWGITYFDMYNHEEITKQLKMDTLINTTDYIHPSSSGYDILTPFIADYMKTSMVPCKQEILQTVLGK